MSYFAELSEKLMDKIGGAPASNGIVTVPSTSTNTTPLFPGQLYPASYTAPYTNPPSQAIHYNYAAKRPSLSDFDIELMAACITNHHPVIDGQTHCFCMLKRLERGISKD